MDFNHTVKAFTAGILSPNVQGRFDFSKVQLGLSEGINMIVSPEGTVSGRYGSKFIANTKYDNKKSRIMDFVFDREFSYALEVGDQYIRFFRDKAAVVGTVTISNGDFTTDIAGWTNLSSGTGSISHDAVDLRMQISGGSGGIGYAEQAITTISGGDYYMFLSVFDNDVDVVVGSSSGASDIKSATRVSGGVREVSFKATGATTYIGFKNSSDNVSEIDNVSIYSPIEVATPYLESEVADLRYTQDGNTMYITHPSHPPKKLIRISDTSWSFTDMVFEPDTPSISTLTVTAAAPPAIPRDFTWVYTVSVVNSEGVEGMPFTFKSVLSDIDLADRIVTVTFTVASGDLPNIKQFRVFRQGGGYMELIHIIDATASTSYSFKDSGLVSDPSESALESFNYFNGADKYPAVCGQYNQRLVLGATNEKVNSLWLSAVSEFETFSNTPLFKANESIERKFSSGNNNKIQHLSTLDDLLCFTEGRIWRVNGTSNDNLEALIESSVGAASPRPILSRKSLMFVESNGSTVSDFIYKDSVSGYDGDVLDILVKNLFLGFEVKDISFQDSPNGLLYALRSDGKMPTMTYLKNQDVYAWTIQETSGDYESIVSIDKNVFDETYYIVKRTVDGVVKRFVETFQTELDEVEDIKDEWRLDSALLYEGSDTSTVHGLEHLAGETVTAYSDGDVYHGLTVASDGSVALPRPSTKCLVGLPYVPLAATIPLDLDSARTGSTVGVKRSIASFTATVINTRGIYYSSDGINYEQRDTVKSDAIGDPLPKYTERVTLTVSGTYSDQVRIFIKQPDPLPIRIANISMNVKFGS